MKFPNANGIGFFHILLVLFFLAAGCLASGCSGGGSGVLSSPASSSDLSRLTEISSGSQSLAAVSGGTITFDALTVTFGPGILPVDATVKISKGSVSNSVNDPDLEDLTDPYVLSLTSSTNTVELNDSANLVFRINPEGFDDTSIRLVAWDGYEWEEIPATFDSSANTVSTTVEALLPFGTRIYLANPVAGSTTQRTGGQLIVSEFVAMKVVAERSESSSGSSAAKADSTTGRKVFIASTKGKFKVSYVQVADAAQNQALATKASEVAGYMDNAYDTIVTGMGLKTPDKTTKPGYGKAWPVDLKSMSGVYGTADPGTNSIAINTDSGSGDGLSHTCHHEFTHLVQFKVLYEVGNDVEDSLDWFGETMADAVGYYAQKGLGKSYCNAGESMGYFYVRLDADNHSIGREKNDNYEYQHYPFISYLLAVYGDAKFKKFFETWYTNKPAQLNMSTIDAAATTGLGKVITGRDGIFWDFYRDYFISGSVFNKDKFNNLSSRESGKPYDITDDIKSNQGVTIVEVDTEISYQNTFTVQRLAGQVLILRYKGSSSLGLSVQVSSAPGQSSGRIQVFPIKRQGGVLQSAGTYDEVSDGSSKTLTYDSVGTAYHDIYILMANTTWKADDYKVTVSVSES